MVLAERIALGEQDHDCYNTANKKAIDYVHLSSCQITLGRQGGLMFSARVCGPNGLGSLTDWGHCVVFLGKTLNFHSASLHPGA